MLNMMVRPRQAPCLLLGVGTYYVGAAHNMKLGAHPWQTLRLKNPLIVDGQHARALFRRHRTNSSDHKTASAGAWALRDHAIANGHDAIIVIEGVGSERHLTVAHFDTASVTRDAAPGIAFMARDRSRVTAGVVSQAPLAKAS